MQIDLHWMVENNYLIICLFRLRFYDKFYLDFENTLAHTCCINGQAECFNCCIQHDVSVNILNKQDETPLDIARKCGRSVQIEKAGILITDT